MLLYCGVRCVLPTHYPGGGLRCQHCRSWMGESAFPEKLQRHSRQIENRREDNPPEATSLLSACKGQTRQVENPQSRAIEEDNPKKTYILLFYLSRYLSMYLSPLVCYHRVMEKESFIQKSQCHSLMIGSIVLLATPQLVTDP